MSELVTFETDYWTFLLPADWRREPLEDEDCFAVESEDETKKIFIRTFVPQSAVGYDIPTTIAKFEEVITTAYDQTLNSTHKRFITEQQLLPPYSTLLLAGFDAPAHFGIAAMTFVASDHQLCISVHNYWSDDQSSFEKFFRDVISGFHPIQE